MAAFDSARDLLAWALEDAHEFDLGIQAYLENAPYTQVTELDPDEGHLVAKIYISPIPSHLRKLASHAVWDLKHALDHATVAAVREVSGTDPGDIHFPFSSSPKDLTWKLNHVPKGKTEPRYPVALHPIFRRFEPYPTANSHAGGSDELCAFSKMANVSKHAIALTAAPRSFLTHFRTADRFIRMFPNNWDSAKQELTIGHLPLGSDARVDIEIVTYVSFSDVPLFGDHDAARVLGAIGEAIEGIVDDLAAETAAILEIRS